MPAAQARADVFDYIERFHNPRKERMIEQLKKNVLRWYLGLADRPAFESGYAILKDMGPILQS